MLIFIGFNLTYFPQFIIGSRGMPRRYFDYTRLLEANPEFTFYQILSTVGGYLFVGGLVLVAFTLLRSLFAGAKAPPNPWGAATLEWQCDVAAAPRERPRAGRGGRLLRVRRFRVRRENPGLREGPMSESSPAQPPTTDATTSPNTTRRWPIISTRSASSTTRPSWGCGSSW